MALIKCTECGKEFSEKSLNCPNCGCPTEDVLLALSEERKKKEERKIEKENKKKEKMKREISPKFRKKMEVIITVMAALVIAASLCGWYFGIKVPRDNAFSVYTDTVAKYNDCITQYNESAMSYNEIANEIIAENETYAAVIDEAQAVIDSGDTPYEAEKMTTLSNTLKNARNNKIDAPELHVKISPYDVDDALSGASLEEINKATAEIDEQLTSLHSEKDSIDKKITKLNVPDYSSTIKTIEEQKEELEESYKIFKQLEYPTQDWVVSRLENVENIANLACATEENDPNGNLGKDGAYTSQIYYSTPLLGTETIAGDKLIDRGTDAGGSVETYKTVEDAEKRNEYLSAFDGTIFDSGKHTVLGTMVVRVSTNLTASKQEQFINEIIAALIAP